MYKIGEFSRITKLSQKTLRYYDEENILVPSGRDETNGYRLYSADDCKKAELISLLRRFNFTILEIKDVMVHYETPADLSYYLLEKKAQITKRIKEYRELIRLLDSFVSKTESEEKAMQYEIETKTIPSALAATVRYNGKYSDTGRYYGQLFAAVKGNANGTPFNCYYDCDYRDDDADIEVCVPVKCSVSGSDVTTKQFAEIRAISTIHVGPYETLSGAYKALTDYAIANGLTVKSPSREIYHKGPGMLFKGNPNNYVTELIFEVE